MDRETRIKRLRFRAWHRGVREADMMVGGYFDAHHANWDDAEIAWFEALMEEQDIDIMAWAMGTQPVPDRWDGPMMNALKQLNYIQIPK